MFSCLFFSFYLNFVNLFFSFSFRSCQPEVHSTGARRVRDDGQHGSAEMPGESPAERQRERERVKVKREPSLSLSWPQNALNKQIKFYSAAQQNADQICLSWLTPDSPSPLSLSSPSLSASTTGLAGAQLHVGIRNGDRLGAGHRHASVSEHGHRWQVHGAIERRIVHK